ncbi:Melanocyte protein PMEL [Channa argus]|uniref:Melanocyte protein PMEL n=1 Tax=Channa argus TaxID=215402 RepID=A0A6G1PHH6_CHAAH|nr:Melanocyte protein PMEL [Channa argus]
MRTLTLVLLLSAFMTANTSEQKSQFTRYPSWNSRIYPVWKEGDPRFRNCWFGGEVTFDLKNDGPTLIGARTTFTIKLNFPPNQTVQSDGQVVWARNCTINGQHYRKGQAVYPKQDAESKGVFPDGKPFTRTKDKKPHYVFVWKTWGRYWQVADGPSSSLTIGTDNVPLGSYNMEVVIYHCRGKNKFIPLGYASSVFTITDQVPFTISLAQVNDVNEDDQNFIQNRAIAFSIKLHDPSQYLNNADINFSWDFGDNSGTLISRDLTVTHTYLYVGTFRPQVVLTASIPNGCENPTASVPVDASAAPVVVVMASTPAPASAEGDIISLDVPTSDATPLVVSVQPVDAAADTEEGEAAVNADAEAVQVASVVPAVADAEVVPEEQDLPNTVAPALEADVAEGDEITAAPVAPAAEEADTDADAEVAAVDAEADVASDAEVAAVDAEADIAPEAEVAAVDAEADVASEAVVAAEAEVATVDDADVAATAAGVVQAETEAPVDNIVVPPATQTTAVEEAAPADAEILDAENEAAATVAAAEQAAGEEEVAPAESEVQAEVETETAQVALVVAKRQAPEMTPDCMVYRYGSLATSVEVVQGIESVEIVEVSNVVSVETELDQNAVDVTVTCQGSLPREVCTVISDADCITPVETICTAATPSPDCQMVLRQFFNESGVFCINVSLTNDVSLAVTSARVSVTVGSSGSPAGAATIVLGVMVLACVVCCVGLMYRRFKQYQPLREDHDDNNGERSAVTSVPLLLWSLLSRQSPGESRPLLQGRIV